MPSRSMYDTCCIDRNPTPLPPELGLRGGGFSWQALFDLANRVDLNETTAVRSELTVQLCKTEKLKCHSLGV